MDMHASETAIPAIDVDVSRSVPAHPCDVSKSKKEINVPISDNIKLQRGVQHMNQHKL